MALWHNGVVESSHNRIRDVLLEENSTKNLTHARILLDEWLHRYNEFHPYS
ncbi:integrase core domain-containing protein [Auritidibacter sp. NML100628]|uniref:integrase core domain-containing protein n=1 Tax=Auritidibacter sp. NML100628 TaxID=2170742 RepID=UPI000D727B66|nr:hypothetical protein DCC24_01750 [Auritidibacter sp. NML100628]